MAQVLTGFNDAPLGRKLTLQLPVADPLGFDETKMHHDPANATIIHPGIGDQAFANLIADSVLDANHSAAAARQFPPDSRRGR